MQITAGDRISFQSHQSSRNVIVREAFNHRLPNQLNYNAYRGYEPSYSVRWYTASSFTFVESQTWSLRASKDYQLTWILELLVDFDIMVIILSSLYLGTPCDTYLASSYDPSELLGLSHDHCTLFEEISRCSHVTFLGSLLFIIEVCTSSTNNELYGFERLD